MKINRAVLNEIIAQAKNELPDESCGYLLANAEGIIDENFPMTNIDHSPEHFSFDPKEQFAAIKHSRQTGKKLVANWHSHPSSPSRPSVEDIKLAYDSTITYFILSLATEEPVFNGFHIENGSVEKLVVEVVD
ncbi:MAG: M67 family metallopeptidase [Paludibacteraceae bacterium]|nr:M67 family metallopeptidase [Paludibacteraceae bacterium]MCR5569162.1 M67 family metallopeptidase [Paludibacteraceae bacterium]